MKIKSFDELKKMSSELKKNIESMNKGENAPVQIKIAMATCGIASGAKEIMDFYTSELDKQGIKAVVSQTGCMGYCYAEPTIEVKLPGKDPVVFGYVDVDKAREILEKYIKEGELVEGIIPVNYETVDK